MSNEAARRWRLVLGRYAGDTLGGSLNGRDQEIDGTLDYLYGREYAGKVRSPRGEKGRGASLDPSQIQALDWLQRSRKLFPREVFERVQSHALDRYGIN